MHWLMSSAIHATHVPVSVNFQLILILIMDDIFTMDNIN